MLRKIAGFLGFAKDDNHESKDKDDGTKNLQSYISLVWVKQLWRWFSSTECMDWKFFSLLLIASFFLISLSLELSLTLELSSSNTLSAYWKKKRREKRLKPSNTWLVSAFVCFRVWERSKGDIDERKISEFLSPWNRETILINYLACWIAGLKANETIYAWSTKKKRKRK